MGPLHPDGPQTLLAPTAMSRHGRRMDVRFPFGPAGPGTAWGHSLRLLAATPAIRRFAHVA